MKRIIESIITMIKEAHIKLKPLHSKGALLDMNHAEIYHIHI